MKQSNDHDLNSYEKYGKWVGNDPTQTPSKIAFRNKVKQAIKKYENIQNGKTKRY